MTTLATVATPLQTFLETHAVAGSGTLVMLPTATRQDLCELFADMGYRCGAEIGVWTGLFSEQLCLANPGVQLTCVDPWQQYPAYQEKKNRQIRLDGAYREACERLKPFGCRIIRMTSVKAAALVPDGSLDFVYVDSNHAYKFVIEDLEAWAPKVRSGGIVAGHDYELPPRKATWIDVREAVHAFTEANQISPWYVVARERKAPSFFWVVP